MESLIEEAERLVDGDTARMRDIKQAAVDACQSVQNEIEAGRNIRKYPARYCIADGTYMVGYWAATGRGEEIDAILSMSDEEILADFHCTPEEYAKLMRQVFELTAKLVRTEEAVQDLITICRGHLSNAHDGKVCTRTKRCRDEEARKPNELIHRMVRAEIRADGAQALFRQIRRWIESGRLHQPHL